MQATIILNRSTGPIIARQRRDEVLKAARSFGWDGTILEASLENSVGSLVKSEVLRGSTHVIICGGDGSVLEALGVLAGTEVELGVVPMGTGNLFARNLHLPLHLHAALRAALKGEVVTVDVGRANGTVFGVMAGIGWDAATVRDADRKLKDRLGVAAYLVAALRNLNHRQVVFSVQVDGHRAKRYKAKSVLVANAGYLTSTLKLFPSAHLGSGTLDIAIIQAESLRSWLGIVFRSLFGHFADHPSITVISAKEVTITCRRRQPVQCDGNDFPVGRLLEARVEPSAVRVHVAEHFALGFKK